MAASKDFCWPSRAKDIIARDLKFAGYVPHYKILTGNIFSLIFKMIVIIGCTGLGWNLYDIMGWESFGVVRFDLGPLLQGQTRIGKVKSAYNYLIICCTGLGW